VEVHGGRIWVDSEVGRGPRNFISQIPIFHAEASASTPAAAARGTGRSFRVDLSRLKMPRGFCFIAFHNTFIKI